MPESGVVLCAACPNPALVQWSRRSSDDPMHVDAVYACGPHAIHLDVAAQVHQARCTAPDPAVLPGCDCTPEPLPAPEPISVPQTTLATGWVVTQPEDSAAQVSPSGGAR